MPERRDGTRIELVLGAGLLLSLAQTSRPAAGTTDLVIEAPFPVAGAPAPIVHRYAAAQPEKDYTGLLLVSGWASGTGWFHFLASNLAARGGIEVWTLERREAFLEDRSILERATAAAPALDEQQTKILGALSLRSLCTDVAAALERMRLSGAKTVVLGGWSATGPLLASFAAFDAAQGRRGLERVDGLVAFDTDLHWPDRAAGDALRDAAEHGRVCDLAVVPELVNLERAARAGKLADLLDNQRGTTSFAALYDVRFGRDCPAQRMLDVYLGPGRPHEWYFPTLYHADTYALHGRDLLWPAQGFIGLGGLHRPAFVVLSRALAPPGEELPDGVRWFEKTIAGGECEIVRVPELGHAGILVADAAVAAVFDPLERWLRARTPAR